MASVTVNLTGYTDGGQGLLWSDDISLGSTFDANGQSQILSQVILTYTGSAAGQVALSLVGTNEEFTPEFEATGRIIFEASDGETLGGDDCRRRYVRALCVDSGQLRRSHCPSPSTSGALPTMTLA